MEKISHTKEFLYFIGIDVSKETIDVTMLEQNKTEIIHYQRFTNDKKGFTGLNKKLSTLTSFNYENTLFCLEHTGLYTRRIVVFLLLNNASVWMESSLQIKRSIGLNRGKNDKIDSLRIAQYAKLHAGNATLSQFTNKTLYKLKDLLSLRKRLINSMKAQTVPLKEIKLIDPAQYKELSRISRTAINGINKSLKAVEEVMMRTVLEDEDLVRLFNLATSVKGVGKILTCYLLVYTNGFTRLTDTRKLACYSGIAPFEHTSGSSIRGKPRTSSFANKDLKALLHMAAMASIVHNPDIKAYYKRKVAEGKSKMSVINAARNKLLSHVLAVIKRGHPYQLNYTN
jgi:transposase